MSQIGCPCRNHYALKAPLYAQPIKLLVYLAHYQTAGDCCRTHFECRVRGCREDEFGDFTSLYVPLCVNHFSMIVVEDWELDQSHEVQLWLNADMKNEVYRINQYLRQCRNPGAGVDTDSDDSEDEAASGSEYEPGSDDGLDSDSDDGSGPAQSYAEFSRL